MMWCWRVCVGKARAWCVTCAATGKWRRGVRPAKPISAAFAARLIGKDGKPTWCGLRAEYKEVSRQRDPLVSRWKGKLKCHGRSENSIQCDYRCSRTVVKFYSLYIIPMVIIASHVCRVHFTFQTLTQFPWLISHLYGVLEKEYDSRSPALNLIWSLELIEKQALFSPLFIIGGNWSSAVCGMPRSHNW